MNVTPKSNRLHIAIFGKRNVGKSSVINALTNQKTSIVSDTLGTTTDPVSKAMELAPLGPVVLIDTAGIDDEGALGELRIEKTLDIIDKTDIALLVMTGENEDITIETKWISILKDRKIPVVGVINKIDKFDVDENLYEEKLNLPFVKISAKEKKNIDLLKESIIKYSPLDFERNTLVGDIVKKKDLVIVVAPQDIQAPKGRLILPQVQVIRDILDSGAMALTVKDSELQDILQVIEKKPDLVITDSQVFKKVNSLLDDSIPLTSFSIIMARYKGDLNTFISGAEALKNIKDGAKILIAEGCTHHALKGDIAREKLPNWIKDKYGDNIEFNTVSGTEFPRDLSKYSLVIHCGSCMLTRKELLSRISRCKEQNVPITNFGVAIAGLNNILYKVTKCF